MIRGHVKTTKLVRGKYVQNDGDFCFSEEPAKPYPPRVTTNNNIDLDISSIRTRSTASSQDNMKIKIIIDDESFHILEMSPFFII